MTSIELYDIFLIKINKNDTNKNVNVSEGIFVKLFNEQAQIWLKNEIKDKSSFYEKNHLANLLKIDHSLDLVRITPKFTEFKLPDDYFDYASSYSLAKKGNCERELLNWDFKIKNKNALLQDNNSNPSFEYEETLIQLTQDNLIVFKTDFDILNEYLSYYKLPVKIDIKGYIKEDGSYSKTVNSDLDDHHLNEIINMIVVDVIAIYENPDGYAMAKERLKG